jgi:hypothetical protein
MMAAGASILRDRAAQGHTIGPEPDKQTEQPLRTHAITMPCIRTLPCIQEKRHRILNQCAARLLLNSWTSRRITKIIMSPPFEIERSSDFPLEPADADECEDDDVAE